MCTMGLLMLAVWHHERLAQLGTENSRLRHRLAKLSQESPPTPTFRDALAEEAPPEKKAQKPRQRRRRGPRTLDELLMPAMPSPKQPQDPILRVADCQELESDPEYYYGRRIVATATLSRFGTSLLFENCMNLDISLEGLTPQQRESLFVAFSNEPTQQLIVAGRFRGLTLYAK